MSEQTTSMSYAEFAKPLIQEIRNAITKVTDENPGKYTEFDVYNALALSITLFTTRNLPEDTRKPVNAQSVEIAKAMTDAGLAKAQADEAYLTAMVVGAARAVTTVVGLIEASNEAQEEVAQDQA